MTETEERRKEFATIKKNKQANKQKNRKGPLLFLGVQIIKVITRNLPHPSRFPQFAAKTKKNVKSLIFLIYALNEVNALLTLDTDFILHSET